MENMPMVKMPDGLQTAIFLLGKNANNWIPQLLKQYFPGKRPWIIADGNTWDAAGKKIHELLEKNDSNPYEPFLFPADPKPHPDYAVSQKLAALMPLDAVPLAVGSGVINDLVKCAANINNLKYCCVATACSVDGYTSNGGAMTVNGTKKTVPCPAPYAICADVDVLENAPEEMFAAGYADLLAKITGGADWLIAAELGFEPIREDIWELIQLPLHERISKPADMGAVFAGLASSGYGMQMYHDSRPASGSEHMFSHVWEMEHLAYNGVEVSHGFKVGIGTLISTLLFEYIVENDFESLKTKMKSPLQSDERRQEAENLLKRGCYGSEIADTAMKKYLSPAETYNRRELIGKHWENLQKTLAKQIIPFEKLRSLLRQANCPAAPSQIGLSKEQLLHAVHTAQMLRIRYTVLDLLYECGLLDDACRNLEKLF